MSEILLLVGFALFLVGGIGFLIASFRTGILWGLAVMFIPGISLIYLIVHWQDAKKSFLLQVLGSLMMMLPIVFPVLDIFPIGAGFTSSQTSVQQLVSSTPIQHFSCDGRQYCSQMTSRAEAEYFLKNCPDTKMDGDHNGIPCENDSRF